MHSKSILQHYLVRIVPLQSGVVSYISKCSPMLEIPHPWNACMLWKRVPTSYTHFPHVVSFRCGRKIKHVIPKTPA